VVCFYLLSIRPELVGIWTCGLGLTQVLDFLSSMILLKSHHCEKLPWFTEANNSPDPHTIDQSRNKSPPRFEEVKK
jgi:hypothetical protein